MNKQTRLFRLFFLISLIFTSLNSFADYFAVGKISAGVDGMFSVKTYDVAWFQNSKGEKWQPPRTWKDVDDFNPLKGEITGMCFVRMRSKTSGVIGWAIDKFSNLPIVYGTSKEDRDPKLIEPDYLVFQCEKR